VLQVLTLILALAGAAVPAAAQGDAFEWTGTVAPGKTVEVRGLNGEIRARPSDDGQVHVEATQYARGAAPTVRIAVDEHDGGITVCAVVGAVAGAAPANACRSGNGRRGVRDDDLRIDFVVRVPQGVRFSGATVNGDIVAEALRSDVRAATVNGRVNIQTTGFVSNVSTVNGDVMLEVPSDLNAEFRANTVHGKIDADFPLTRTTRSSFPDGRPALDGPQSVRGTIGSGGPELRVSTVNGSIELRRR
jgi:hypothetical protein